MQDIERLTPTEIAILEALATYRYLIADHMMMLGVTKSKRHLYATLQKLSQRRKALLGRLDFGVLPTVGRLAVVYHLTERGAAVLEDTGRDYATIHYPKRVRLFARDYFHRLLCIEFHIALVAWTENNGASLDFYQTYYDYGGKSQSGRFSPATTIRWDGGQLTPDGVFQFTTTDGKTRLCALELHRGTDLGRLDRQLTQYADAIRHNALEHAHSYSAAARILIVFDNPSAIANLKTRIKRLNLPPEIQNLFFVKLLADLKTDFQQEWNSLDGASRPLY